MTSASLLAQFDRLTEAPDAVPRLRRFILDLAVRGKLVEQDQGDEPASELLKRIQVEKERLVGQGKIRNQTARVRPDDGTPFDLPKSWAWIRIGEGFNYDAGTKREPKELEPDGWLLELEDIEKDTSVILTRMEVRERDPRSIKSQFEIGDILYGKLRPYLNKVVVATEPGYSTTEIVAIRAIIPLCSGYCCMAFRRPDFVEYVDRLGRGTKMPRLRTPDALVAPFPLPPLAEQHRIAARVDELMALCDELEAAQAERERNRDRLTAASRHRLSEPDEDGVTFREHARFYVANLSRMTARPDQVPLLRQTILSLAVRGKLVEQDLSDEPASELLARIGEQRSRLARGGKGQKRNIAPVGERDAPYSVPTGWSWTRLGQIGEWGSGSTPARGNSELFGGETTWLKSGELNDDRQLKGSEETITELALDKGTFRRNQPGDVLIAMYGATIGRIAILSEPAVTNQAVCGCTLFAGIHNLYLFYFLLSRRTYFHSASEGGAQPNISKTKIVNAGFPLPPFAEQQRIVTKVDELIALCDELEEQLNSTQTGRSQLLEAVLHEALASGAATGST